MIPAPTRQRWADERMPDICWRPLPTLTHTERSAEQDAAAGGHDRRVAHRTDGTEVIASLFLRVPPKGRRCYAYLRFAAGHKTREIYVGQVCHSTREENLAAGWDRVHERGLLTLPKLPEHVTKLTARTSP